jgi:hypothetical protein
MKKITIGALAVISILAITYGAYAKRKKKPSLITKKVSSLFILGDSQVKRHIGSAFKEVFQPKGIEVKYFGLEGARPSTYLKESSRLLESELVCSDVVFIQLGDNGVNSPQNISSLEDEVKRLCPSATIVWGGPFKVVLPTNSSQYVNDDPTSPRYIHTYNKTKKVWIDRIKEGLSNDAVFIDGYSLQETEPKGSDFSESRDGDGVHLTYPSAYKYATIVDNILFSNKVSS